MKKNILLVEYNSDTIDAVSQHLHHNMFDITIAGDQTVARALLTKKPFDLVISATLLPKSHGFTLAKYISQNFSDTKVILMCDKIEDEDYRQEGMNSGACEFMEKPLEESTFRKLVMQHLGLAQLDLFGYRSADSTNLLVLPLLDQLEDKPEPREKPGKDDAFDDIIKDVKVDNDPYEIKLD
jgi:DNA-binding response OmpR family regulator